MSAPLPPAREDFDLSAEMAWFDRRMRIQRTFFAGVGASMAVLGLWVVLPPYHQSATTLWVLAGVVWGISAMFLHLSLRRVEPPLSALGVDSSGLTFRYPDGTSKVLAWDDPAFGITLVDSSEDRGAPRSQRNNIWLSTAPRRGGFVPAAVLEALVKAADRRGIPVLVREEVVPAGKGVRLPEVTRIGRPENTPGWAESIPRKPTNREA